MWKKVKKECVYGQIWVKQKIKSKIEATAEIRSQITEKKIRAEDKIKERSIELKGKMAVVTHEARGRARHSREAMKKKSGEIVKSGGEKASKKVEHLKNRAGLIEYIQIDVLYTPPSMGFPVCA